MLNAKTKNDVDQLLTQIQTAVENFRSSDNYLAYLKGMKHFRSYSIRNTILIVNQNPGATRVAGFNAWKETGRKVKRGEHGLQILCPLTKKISEEEKNDPSDPDFKIYGFRKGYVFDISQTEPIPGADVVNIHLCDELQGNVPNFEQLVAKLVEFSGIPVSFHDYASESKGYYSPSENCIVVQASMPETQKLKTLIHEVAHSMLHNPSEIAKRGLVSPDTKEVEAESTAFIVADWLGIDTSSYSVPYLTSWTEEGTDAVLKSLDYIKKASGKIIEALS